MQNKTILFFLVLISFFLTSCATQNNEIIVAKYGNNSISKDEFEKAYVKNVGSLEIAQKATGEQLSSFLDLYLNFKMKLKDAENRGFQNDEELLSELTDYKKKVGVTFMLEKDIVEPGIQKLYEQRKKELRVSHLMVRPDTLGLEGARNKAQEFLNKILNNEKTFEELTRTYSDDHFSKENDGDIFFITAGQILPSFEDAAYDTEVGTVYPKVVETRYGMHIIKVTDVRERIPQIRARHILIDFFDEEGNADTTAALAKITEIKNRVAAGEDFSELAKTYSEDPGSKEKGGDLGFFERRMMVKEFDEAAFNLNLNEVSGIVQTPYGFHIIQIVEKKVYPSFEENKEDLKRIFKQTRYNDEYELFVNNLKKKYNYKLNESTFGFIASRNDSVRFGADYFNAAWRDEVKNHTLFSFDNKNVSVDSFFIAAGAMTEFANKLIEQEVLKNAINKYSTDLILEEEALKLDQKNEDFAQLMDEYKNGIYVFKLQEEEVWQKIELDSARMHAHYLATKEKYNWTDRVSFSEIFARKDSTINYYYSLLKDGADFDELAREYTERPGYKERDGNFGLVDAKGTQLAQKASELKNPGDFSEPIANSGGFSIVRLNSKDPARPKTFEEARAEVAGSFQEVESKRLEKEYIERLRNLYKPVIYTEQLEKAFKEE